MAVSGPKRSSSDLEANTRMVSNQSDHVPPRRFVWLLLLVGLSNTCVILAQDQPSTVAITIVDTDRGREIPTVIYLPTTDCARHPARLCQVALLSSGYGILNTEYTFIANALTQRGYLVAAIQHELPDDPPLSTAQPYATTRKPNWSRGVQNLKIARTHLERRFPEYDWDSLLLVGHSNGGDISSLFATDNETLVSNLVTIDHRRMPLPRSHAIRILSVRGSDFEADAGVLPSLEDQKTYEISIEKIAGARHDDMYDGGEESLKNKITTLIGAFLDSEQVIRKK